jgi:molybdenum cofactor cytidylyltransferase
MTLAIAILAAGQSRRLGQDKQLVQWQGKTLLQHAIDTASKIDNSKVLVTLGASAQLHWSSVSAANHCTPLNVHDSEEGMAASIRAVANYVIQPNLMSISAVLIMLVDQYRVDGSWLNALNNLHKLNPDRPIASYYASLCAVPAIIPQNNFEMLARLKGDRGARDWLRAQENLIKYHAPHEPGDVDSLHDLSRMRS